MEIGGQGVPRGVLLLSHYVFLSPSLPIRTPIISPFRKQTLPLVGLLSLSSDGEAITLLLILKLRTVNDEREARSTNKGSSESRSTNNEDSSESQAMNEESVDGVFVLGEGWPANKRIFRVWKSEEER